MTGSVEFDGTDDNLMLLEHVASALVNWKSTAYTIEYWINGDAFGESTNNRSNVVGNSVQLVMESDGVLAFGNW